MCTPLPFSTSSQTEIPTALSTKSLPSMDKISPVRIDKVSLTFINDSYVQIDSSNQDCLHKCLCGNDCVVSERNFICNYDNDTLDCDNPIRSMPHLVGQYANKVSSTPYKNDFGNFVYKDCGDDNLREDQSPPHNVGHHSPEKNVDNSNTNSNMNNHVLNNDTNTANVNSDYVKNFINKDDVFDNVNKFINNDDVNKGINKDYVNDNLNCIKNGDDVNKGVKNDCVNDNVNNINHEDINKGINNDYVNDNVNNRINNGDDVNKSMNNDCVNDNGNSFKNDNDVNKGMNNNYVNDDVNNSLENGDDINKGINNYYVNYVMVENVNSVAPCNSISTFGDTYHLVIIWILKLLLILMFLVIPIQILMIVH